MCALIYSSCWVGRKEIIDRYEVTWGDYYEQGWEGYTFFSDLVCNREPIENIRSVEWNHKIIIVEKNNEDNDRWYIFLATKDTIEYCYGDTLIGPVNKDRLDSIMLVGRYMGLQKEVFVK